LESQKYAQVQQLVERFKQISLTLLSPVERQLLQNKLNMTLDELVAAVENGQFESLRGTDMVDHLFQPPRSKDNKRYTRSAQADHKPRGSDKAQKKQAGEIGDDGQQRLVDTLFRRAASKLHPDHESDVRKREQKQQLMKELLAARKAGNVGIIFDMYQRYVDESVDSFTVPDLQSVIAVLERQVRLLDRDYHALINRSPTHKWVHHHIVEQSEIVRQRTFSRLKREVEAGLAEVLRLKSQLQNPAGLKAVLDKRRQSHL
ncbi:MAG: hypothetical protein AAF404_06660, partial [Pseudomonadota bacterium]